MLPMSVPSLGEKPIQVEAIEQFLLEGSMVTDTNEEGVAAETSSPDTIAEVPVTERGPDLVWDKEAPGLCVRVHGNGAKKLSCLSTA